MSEIDKQEGMEDMDAASAGMSQRRFISGAGAALAGTALVACSNTESVAQQSGGATAAGGAVAGAAGEEAPEANAGISIYSTLAETTPQAFRDVVDVNLVGVASSVKAVAPHMTERRSGRIVAVASTEGRHGAPALSSYVVSKWGVIGLVKAMAYELGQAGVTVNAISPTGVRTAMTENEATYRWANPDDPSPENLEAALREYNALPVGRLEPEDVAEGVVFLASPEARYISGVALDLAAGANARYTA